MTDLARLGLDFPRTIDYAFVCPGCGSKRVTITRDASLAYSQRVDGETVVIEDPYVSTFDEVLDVECLDCHKFEERPGSEWDG